VPEATPLKARHPLLERLVRDCGIPEVDTDSVDAFVNAEGDAVLFFSEDLLQHPESGDVAVVLPELVRAFHGRFRAALVSRASERALQKRYGFARWPALVFLRGGEHVGTITSILDWDEYLAKVAELLAAPTRREAAAEAARANRAAATEQQETT
jgi:hydrogenase-1 operon protein HyaE